jgi:hypothetical protein
MRYFSSSHKGEGTGGSRCWVRYMQNDLSYDRYIKLGFQIIEIFASTSVCQQTPQPPNKPNHIIPH